MPLTKSSSQAALDKNISELMHSYKKGGRFAKGKSADKAHQMAIAAAFQVKREARKGSK